jgi:hypothetical protein
VTETRNVKKSARGRVIVLSSLGLAFLILAGVIAGGPLWHSYDKSHMISITCTVESAQGEIGSSTSGKGIGSSRDQVKIDTGDCGPLILRQGVTSANKESLAEKFDRGERYRFEIGEASYRWRGWLTFWRTDVIVTGFAREDASS